MSKPQSMKAAVYQQYGPPEVLEVTSVPIPAPADEEVLIRVRYSTVNRTDCGFLRAEPFIVRFFAGLTKPKNQILGCEFAGEVTAIGSSVTEYMIGDRVVGFKDDEHGFGGHAQYTTAPVNGLLGKIPNHLSFAEAAPALEGAHYALQGIRATGMQHHQRVLVNGATGSIGSAALQILRSMDVAVTAVCATPHVDKMLELGATDTVDYLSEDFTQLDKQFDAVLDAVGKSSFGRCKPILKPQGCYTSTEFGDYFQNPLLALWTKWFSQQQVYFPIPKNEKSDADYICDLMQQQKFRPLIDRTFSLDDIAEAYRYVETGEKIGNVLIEIN